jgi:phosphosulfolactate synthase
MTTALLDLPVRTSKPRTTGLTMVIDPGLPTSYFNDAITSGAAYIDMVKFGWGTSLVTADLSDKIGCLRRLGISYFFGGTLFEKFVVQDRFEQYLEWCRAWETPIVEVSNGTIPMSNTSKAAYIRKCADEFAVVSEVGFKDADRSQHLAPSAWVDCIEEDLEAGASLVIAEARESGRSGICRPDGELRWGLVEDIISSGVDTDRLCWEAPSKELQAHFVTRVGPNVNLGNIAANEVIGVETLRLGLRADTLMHTEGPSLRTAAWSGITGPERPGGTASWSGRRGPERPGGAAAWSGITEPDLRA